MAGLLISMRSSIADMMWVILEVILGFAFGFSKAGFRGAKNTVKTLLTRKAARRSNDGLQRLSVNPIRIQGVLLPPFTHMDEGLWKTTLRRLVK